MSESKLYDATIQLTVPEYDLIHKTLIGILKHHFGASCGRDDNRKLRGVFLDVGAGTGKESLSILRSFPRLNVLAVDLSESMKGEFVDNYNAEFGIEETPRHAFVVGDILSLSLDALSSTCLKTFGRQKRVAAVSAYCIHHFEVSDKRKIYERMYEFLDPGGILINVDLFNYESKVISKYAHDFDIDYIKKQFENPDPEFVDGGRLSHKLRMNLKRKWIDHMNKDNLLDPVETHREILRGLGFRAVECVFRYFQQAVIVATK